MIARYLPELDTLSIMKLHDVEIQARIRSLEMRARQLVEGYLSGIHRSPQHGYAVEFAQHREYTPGDDLRHVDWKVYGRSERIFLKQYEMETNLVCWFLVDSSESMQYGSGNITKYQYASLAAASLAFLILQQSDSVGLATFDAGLQHFLRAQGQTGHYSEILRILIESTSTTRPSRIGSVLHEVAYRIQRRGVVFILSDFLDEIPEIIAGLKHLRYQQHEVIVLHLVDPAEATFPFTQPTLFHGLEEASDLLSDPFSIRESYLDEFRKFQQELQSGCRMNNVEYRMIQTDEDPGTVLAQFLAERRAR